MVLNTERRLQVRHCKKLLGQPILSKSVQRSPWICWREIVVYGIALSSKSEGNNYLDKKGITALPLLYRDQRFWKATESSVQYYANQFELMNRKTITYLCMMGMRIQNLVMGWFGLQSSEIFCKMAWTFWDEGSSNIRVLRGVVDGNAIWCDDTEGYF